MYRREIARFEFAYSVPGAARRPVWLKQGGGGEAGAERVSCGKRVDTGY